MVRFAEKSLDTEQDSSDLQCRAPLFWGVRLSLSNSCEADRLKCVRCYNREKIISNRIKRAFNITKVGFKIWIPPYIEI